MGRKYPEVESVVREMQAVTEASDNLSVRHGVTACQCLEEQEVCCEDLG